MAFQCTPSKNAIVLEHGRKVVDPLLKSLRGKVALVGYSLPGAEDPIRKKLYRSARGAPTDADRRVGAVELERALVSFSYAGAAIPSEIRVSTETPTTDYFRAFQGIDSGEKYDPAGFWKLPIPVMKSIQVDPGDVIFYDAEGYDLLKKTLRPQWIGSRRS